MEEKTCLNCKISECCKVFNCESLRKFLNTSRCVVSCRVDQLERNLYKNIAEFCYYYKSNEKD